MATQIGKKLNEKLVKVVVNDWGDYFLINAGDTSFQERFLGLLKWIEEAQKNLNTLSEEKDKQYKGRALITTDEDGNKEYDLEQIEDLVEIQLKFYRECEQKINDLFGQDALKKYLRICYEANENFVPDEEYISDFLEEITPILNDVFGAKFERAKDRYNKNRKGKNTQITQSSQKVVPMND